MNAKEYRLQRDAALEELERLKAQMKPKQPPVIAKTHIKHPALEFSYCGRSKNFASNPDEATCSPCTRYYQRHLDYVAKHQVQFTTTASPDLNQAEGSQNVTNNPS